MPDLAAHYLTDTRERLAGLRQLGEGALRQLTEADWHAVPRGGDNSAAVIVQHLAGNMHSRWGGFPAEDGESAGRDRDAEFEDRGLDAAALLAVWDAGWAVFESALAQVTPGGLLDPVTIRGEQHTVLQAAQRQVMHYSGHVYQLIWLARHLRGPAWDTLSIPRGGSAAFNLRGQEQRGPG